uniref:XRCC1_N domain-containing protein n=1 Tax=Mesocestoides corti TaxID=53468 RepID=A0A5K3FXN7_MESCO
MIHTRISPRVTHFRGRVIVASGNDTDCIGVESLCLSAANNIPRQWTQLTGVEESGSHLLALVVYDKRLLLLGMSFFP